MNEDQYTSGDTIRESLAGRIPNEIDNLANALELEDASGRDAKMFMMGLLSKLSPFDQFPPEMWQQALKNANSKPHIWAANYAAFNAGRTIIV